MDPLQGSPSIITNAEVRKATGPEQVRSSRRPRRGGSAVAAEDEHATGPVPGGDLGERGANFVLRDRAVERREDGRKDGRDPADSWIAGGPGERIREGNELFYELEESHLLPKVMLAFGQMDQPLRQLGGGIFIACL